LVPLIAACGWRNERRLDHWGARHPYRSVGPGYDDRTAEAEARRTQLYCHAAIFQLAYLNEADARPERSRAGFFGAAMVRATFRLTIGLLVSYAVFLLPAVRHASAPAGGLVGIGLATVANAGYWLWRGARFASSSRRGSHDWVASLSRSEAGRFGVALTGVLVWLVIFACLNAGMQQVGL
jgi:hypothetical protein